MINKGLLVLPFTAVFLLSCASSKSNNVKMVVESRNQYSNKIVSISGILRERNSFYNLFSNDSQECIGVMLTDSQKELYKNMNGRNVAVRGILKPEGCGREGICVEHLCGPTIVTDVTVSH